MDGVVFLATASVILAIVGALATLFGADSRPEMDDTHGIQAMLGHR